MININELFANRIGGNQFSNNLITKKVNIKNINEEMKILDFSKETNNEIIKEDKYFDCMELKKSCSAYLRVEQFVDVDYKSEISISNGVKEILNILPLAFINKDDYIITTIPGCDILANMGKWCDGKVHEYKLNKFNNYLIDFEDIDEKILKKCKILYINYPNNPTGAIANKEFFKDVIKYAKKYSFIVVHDATYIDLYYDDFEKISFLSVEGAKDVGVELYSISKSSYMNDCKLGFIAGNKEIIKAYNLVKEKMDIKQSLVSQKEAIKVLNNYEEIIKENKEKCLRRHNLIKEVLEKVGIKANVPNAGPYLYVQIPTSCNGVSFENALEFSLWLMESEGIIVTPCDNEGKYIRISMLFDAQDEEQENTIAKELENKLKKYKFECK